MLHDGLQKLATAGAESVSMLMTICVGASPPPIELARAAARLGLPVERRKEGSQGP